MIYSRADWGSEYPRGGNVINGPVAEASRCFLDRARRQYRQLR